MGLVKRIKEGLAAGRTVAELAAELGVSEAWVRAVAGTDAAGAWGG